MRKIYARQGDLIFIEVANEAEGKTAKTLVISRGEITGHEHCLVCEAKSSVRGGATHFTLKGTARLVHPEHKEIFFKAGNYIVLRKNEYDPIKEELREIYD